MTDDSTIIEDTEEFRTEETRALLGEKVGGGRYILSEIVGQGGFGRVYRAEETSGDGVWAIKELAFNGSRIILESLDKEQKMLSWLDHGSIVNRKEVFQERERVFLVMEFVEGANLKARLAESDLSMPQEAVIELAIQIADALVHLHGQKPYPIIFSDLKPSNLMLTDTGEVKLVDFGIARLKTPDQRNAAAVGTRGYAAPEQYTGDNLDGRTDLYALGVVMHQAMSKLEPRKHRGQLPPVEHYATAIDPQLASIIHRCTKLKKTERYPSAQLLRKDLEALLKDLKMTRKAAKASLVTWAGLEARQERLASAIEDSVQEVQGHRNDRSTPWFNKLWFSEAQNLRKLGAGAVVLTSLLLLLDGVSAQDGIFLAFVLICLALWKFLN